MKSDGALPRFPLRAANWVRSLDSLRPFFFVSLCFQWYLEAEDFRMITLLL
jgi:hypothetical protein